MKITSPYIQNHIHRDHRDHPPHPHHCHHHDRHHADDQVCLRCVPDSNDRRPLTWRREHSSAKPFTLAFSH